jgi:hypothetical protein
MQIHTLRGSGRDFAFTQDEGGGNLPAQFAPWTLFKTFDLNRGDEDTNFNVNECLDDIDKFGFHLTDAHRRMDPQGLREKLG